ncbi:hypothetical protein M0804_015441 [Polistes exclamans]|nr:hypothetical protein M0804_015441 [Polistes exclamans]
MNNIEKDKVDAEKSRKLVDDKVKPLSSDYVNILAERKCENSKSWLH